MARFPSFVYGRGTEPDVRFSLANERTFLAWIRTALALVAGGVALEVLGLDLNPSLRLASSIVLVVAGTIVPVLAWINWARTELALREDRPLPASLLAAILMVAVTVAGILVTLAVIVR
ncbi:YidH family protein (plasmid) [Coraliomargarita sp. W4R53]